MAALDNVLRAAENELNRAGRPGDEVPVQFLWLWEDLDGRTTKLCAKVDAPWASELRAARAGVGVAVGAGGSNARFDPRRRSPSTAAGPSGDSTRWTKS